MLDVLDRRGYVQRTDGDWALTDEGHDARPRVPRVRPAGRRVPAAAGCSTASTPPTLAGLLSVFVYEHRSPEPPPPPWFPDGGARQRWRRIVAISEDLAAEERATGLGAHRPPDPGFFAAAHGWVAGDALEHGRRPTRS